MRRHMGSLKRAVSDGLEETTTLAKILTERAADTPGLLRLPCCTSKNRTEAINGGVEHLRGIALGFRNLTHAGRLKDHLTTTT